MGIFVLAVLSFARRKRGGHEVRWMIFVSALIVGGVLLAFADTLIFAVSEKGLSDQNRMAVYIVTLRSIFDAPLLGYGYGTFVRCVSDVSRPISKRRGYLGTGA